MIDVADHAIKTLKEHVAAQRAALDAQANAPDARLRRVHVEISEEAIEL